MTLMTRMAALRFAGKVAFGATFSSGMLMGCGSRGALTPGDRPATYDADQTREPRPVEASARVSPDGPPAAADTALASETLADATDTTEASAPDASPPADTSPDAALACLGPIELASGSWQRATVVTAAEATCCIDYAQRRIAEATASGGVASLKEDPSAVNCCKAIIAHVDSGGTRFLDGPVRQACCSSEIVAPRQELWSHALCAPWGPPVPPALDGEQAEIA